MMPAPHAPDTILVVDDESIIRLLVRKILEDEGYSVHLAADGGEAQSIILGGSVSFSAVLLDWAMPKMNGMELLRWVKNEPKYDHIPVIMQTAMDHPDQIKEGIEAGAFYYLTKPIQKDLLKSIVRAAVTDFRYKQILHDKLRLSEQAFGLLEEGTFHFRTLAEGENLAIRIANASSKPEDAMAIAELFTNAVEHGNLGITYEEKSKLLEEGRWVAEVERRLVLSANSAKFVEVRIRRDQGQILVEIEDQGPGFDFLKYITFDETRVFDTHGRGIAMATNALGVQYLDKGNRVRVTVPA
ncbi:MAG: response regulator [Ignavibacteriales bacterium]|nr:response regulator [Ignavibacteriales bacterium]